MSDIQLNIQWQKNALLKCLSWQQNIKQKQPYSKILIGTNYTLTNTLMKQWTGQNQQAKQEQQCEIQFRETVTTNYKFNSIGAKHPFARYITITIFRLQNQNNPQNQRILSDTKSWIMKNTKQAIILGQFTEKYSSSKSEFKLPGSESHNIHHTISTKILACFSNNQIHTWYLLRNNYAYFLRRQHQCLCKQLKRNRIKRNTSGQS